MLFTDAFAQTGAPAAGADPTMALVLQLFPFALIFIVFYFLIIRPQQRRLKAHQEMIANLKKGDVVVTSGGIIGKVRSVVDDEARLEIATNVEVRVLRHTISEVRTRGEPAPANDSKPAKAD
jgi:preprotein translocase subunit YajC